MSTQKKLFNKIVFNGNSMEIAKKVRRIVKSEVIEKDMMDKIKYNTNLINDVIYNEKAHIVAVFKDYLIYDDVSEFLKRIYLLHESKARLPKICEFYESYSKIFPNYTNLPEAKYMYKNIKKKQKVIDNNQLQLDEEKVEEEEEKVIDTVAYNSIMNQSETVNNSRRADETVNSFEGLIDQIGKAEKTSAIKVNLNNKIIIPIFPSPSIQIDKQKHFTPIKKDKGSKPPSNEKNTYNFKLNLNLLKNTNEKKELNTEKVGNNKIIINQIDELQKLKLKVNAGLINSARSKNEKQIRELYHELNAKQITVSPNENNITLTNPNTHNNIEYIPQNIMKDLNTINYDETKNASRYKKDVVLGISRRNSKIFENMENSKIDNKNVFKKESTQKPFQKKIFNNIVIEENLQEAKTKNIIRNDFQANSERKIHHKATSSMSKITPNNIYNNYHIVNNFQNIIVNNNFNNAPKERKAEYVCKIPFSDRTDHTGKSNHQVRQKIKNEGKNINNDLLKIKQNVKKLIVEFNQKTKEKTNKLRTISNENSKCYIQVEQPPLSARVDKDLMTITTNKDTIDKEIESDRTISSRKLISSIIKSDSKFNQLIPRNPIDKSVEKNIKNIKTNGRTASSIIERKDSVLSSNTSAISQKRSSMKSVTKEKSSKNTISPKESKGNFNKNDIFDKIAKNTNFKAENKYAHMNSNKNIPVSQFNSNNPVCKEVIQCDNKQIQSKPILKIKNFFEATKIASNQNNKPSSDRFFPKFNQKNF